MIDSRAGVRVLGGQEVEEQLRTEPRAPAAHPLPLLAGPAATKGTGFGYGKKMVGNRVISGIYIDTCIYVHGGAGDVNVRPGDARVDVLLQEGRGGARAALPRRPANI